jgi:hypothetical protein
MLDLDNYWEWSTRLKDLVICKDLADCLVERWIGDGASLVDPADGLEPKGPRSRRLIVRRWP